MSRIPIAILLAALSCTPALADSFNTTQGGSSSNGVVLQRRQGTSGNTAVPIDENNPFPFKGTGPGGGSGGTFTPLGCPAWLAVTSGSAVSLSSVVGGIPAGATLVAIVPSVGIVLRDDGSAPTTAGPGVVIAAGMYFPSSITPLSNIQAIAQTASGFLTTCFYK
jgi:hypothetical protein